MFCSLVIHLSSGTELIGVAGRQQRNWARQPQRECWVPPRSRQQAGWGAPALHRLGSEPWITWQVTREGGGRCPGPRAATRSSPDFPAGSQPLLSHHPRELPTLPGDPQGPCRQGRGACVKPPFPLVTMPGQPVWETLPPFSLSGLCSPFPRTSPTVHQDRW